MEFTTNKKMWKEVWELLPTTVKKPRPKEEMKICMSMTTSISAPTKESNMIAHQTKVPIEKKISAPNQEMVPTVEDNAENGQE